MPTQVFAVSAGSTLVPKKDKIVIRRSGASSTKQAMQAIVLLSLVRHEIQPPAKCSSVSIVVGSRPPISYMDTSSVPTLFEQIQLISQICRNFVLDGSRKQLIQRDSLEHRQAQDL